MENKDTDTPSTSKITLDVPETVQEETRVVVSRVLLARGNVGCHPRVVVV